MRKHVPQPQFSTVLNETRDDISPSYLQRKLKMGQPLVKLVTTRKLKPGIFDNAVPA